MADQTQRTSGVINSDVYVAGGGRARLAVDPAPPEWEFQIIDRVDGSVIDDIGNVLDGSGWEDEWSDVGGGQILQQADDSDIVRGDVIRCFAHGRPAFQWLARKQTYERVVADDDDPTRRWEGPGRLAALAAARIRPSRGFGAFPLEEARSYGWPSVDYDDSTWSTSSVAIIDQGTTTDYWYGLGDWPDPAAEWMWSPGASEVYSRTGDVFFRTTFTVPSGGWHTIFLAVDDRGALWIDGQRLITTQSWDNTSGSIFTEKVVLSEGEHTIAVWGNNNIGEVGNNPAGVLVSIMPEGGGGSIFNSGAGWKCFPYPLVPPGVTFGQAMNRVLAEAQAAGTLQGLTWTFTDLLDSHGTPWPYVGDITARVGSDVLAFLKAHIGIDCEARIAPGAYQLDLYVAGGGGIVRPLLIDAPTDENDPDSGLLLSQTNVSEGQVATAAIVKDALGLFEVDLTPPGEEKVETYLELQHITARFESERVAYAELARLADIREQITVSLRVDDTAIPWTHYAPGDVLLAVGSDDEAAAQRVRSLAATITSDELKVTPTLGDRILEDVERHEDWLKTMSDGAVRGQSTATTPPALPDRAQPAPAMQEKTWSLPKWAAFTGGRFPFRSRVTTRRWKISLDQPATGTRTATVRYEGGADIATVTVESGEQDAVAIVAAVIDNGQAVEVVTTGAESFAGNATLEWF